MEEIFVFLLQALIEGFAETFHYLPFDGMYYQDGSSVERWMPGRLAIYAIIGTVLGTLSVLIAPHLILPSAPLRLANLLSAPLISGGIAYWAGKGRINRADHFWYAFFFALAFSSVRWGYGNRG